MMEREASASAVVATDPASVNADWDNGTALYGASRLRGRDGAHALVALGLLRTLLPYLDRVIQDAGYGSRTTYLSEHSSEW